MLLNFKTRQKFKLKILKNVLISENIIFIGYFCVNYSVIDNYFYKSVDSTAPPFFSIFFHSNVKVTYDKLWRIKYF